MSSIHKKKIYTGWFLGLMGSLVSTNLCLALQEAPAKDSYTITINASNIGGSYPLPSGKDVYPFYFSVCKTNARGSTIYTKEPQVIAYTGERTIDVSDSVEGDAERREEKLTARVTKYTQLFISSDKDALMAVVNNNATPDQKKKIVSKMMPPKIGSYCSGKITFDVRKINSKKEFSISVDDKRTCTLFKKPISAKIKQVFKKEQSYSSVSQEEELY